MDTGIRKKDFMCKRARLKSRFTSVNFKSRWFVLTDRFLSYHEGNISGNVGKEKGSIPLKDVVAIEFVDEDGLGRKPNGFQVVYKMTNGELCVLYIVAVHADMRAQWVDEIRKACVKLGMCNFNSTYHPGVWNHKESRYTCCDSIVKRVAGCQHVTYQYSAGVESAEGSMTSHSNGFDFGPHPNDKSDRLNRPPPPLPPVKPPPDPKKSVKKVIARYNYQAADPGDLSLLIGEVYEVLDESKDFWWKARNASGEEGYIPTNHVEDYSEGPNELSQYGWYYPSASRQESEEILMKDGNEGCFLVRQSRQAGVITLSMLTKEIPEGMVRHYHIKKTDAGEYYVAEKHTFSTVPELIKYHKHNAGGLLFRLRHPPVEGSGNHPISAGFGHDKWEIDSADLEVHQEIGKGQFGRVCRGKFRKTVDVAVKEMKPGTMREDDFIDEAKTMMQFSHRNLVQLYGVCTKSKPLYIVLEFMKHGALLQWLRQQKTRNNLLGKPGKLLEICIQVSSAMKYLEDNQIIHRDLAARNCLVGDNTVVKVADFGLARFVLDDEYNSSSGTKFPVKWAPPEVLSYTTFSSKSDVWAFGVLMWEIWTGGDSPYGSMRNPQVVDFVVQSRRALSQPEHCTDPVFGVMRKCWKYKADQRPPFRDLYEDLCSIAKNEDYLS